MTCRRTVKMKYNILKWIKKYEKEKTNKTSKIKEKKEFYAGQHMFKL